MPRSIAARVWCRFGMPQVNVYSEDVARAADLDDKPIELVQRVGSQA
jgi:hypothetical protein